MNLSQTAVTNASNLAFFMVNLSHHLLAYFRQLNPGSGIIDLKTSLFCHSGEIKIEAK